MNERARREDVSMGSGAVGVSARRIVPPPVLSTDGKPSWWADVLTGRVRRDWAAMDEDWREGLWARR